MKSQLKKLISIFACVCLLLTALVVPAFAATTTASYVKVTTAPTDWSGDYLIVYEDGNNSRVLNGGLDKIDAEGNYITVAVADNKITANDTTNAAKFTIAKTNAGYTIKSASGYYIGNTSNQNKIVTNKTTTYDNTLTLNTDGTVNIVSADTYLRCNIQTTNGNRFRYFKSTTYTNQKAITLYKLETVTDSGSTGGNEGGENTTPTPTLPAADSTLTLTEANTYGAALTDYTTDKYYVSGKITEFYGTGGTTYGNVYIKDDNNVTFLIYGIYSADGTTRYDAMETKPAVGDTIKVYGVIGQYGGTAQMKNSWLIEHTVATTTPTTPTVTATVVDTPVAGTAYKFGMINTSVSTTDVYYIKGVMGGYNNLYLDTTADASAAADVYLETTEGGYYLYAMVDGAKKYINMVVSGTYVNGSYDDAASTVYTYDDTSKTVVATVNDASYCFGTRNDKNYTTVGPVKVSYNPFYCQFYTVSGESGNEGGDDTPATPTTPTPDSTNTLTIAKAIELGSQQDTGAYTADKYFVTGQVTLITSDIYGNMYISDGNGNEILVYGTYSADGTTRYGDMTTKPDAGDTVTLYGVVGNFNGTPQMKNAWIIDFTDGQLADDGTSSDPAADSTLTIPQAIALGATKRSGEYTTNKYYLTGKITGFYGDNGETYGNIYIEDNAGNKILVYGTYSADGSTRYDSLDVKPAIGDTVTVYGVIGQYNGTAQMKNGWFTVAPTSNGTNTDNNGNNGSNNGTNGTTTTTPNTGVGATTDNISPATGDSVASCVAMAIAAAAVVLYTNKKRA